MEILTWFEETLHIHIPLEDPLFFFGILVALILLAPKVTAFLRLPDIVGWILAGVLFGRHSLGLLPDSESLDLLGNLGLLYIMFTAGLEIDLNQVNRNRRGSATFGLLTFFIPLVLGALAAHFVLDLDWAASILLASMFSSHTLLTYPLVSRLGLGKSSAVTTTIGGTIITDTLAMVVLAVIAGAARGTLDYWFWLRFLGLSTAYGFSILVLVPRLGRWFFQRNSEQGEAPYLFILVLLSFLGWLAHPVGLEPIIGAFLVGITLNRLIPEHSTLMNRVQFVGNALFIPIFLVKVGTLIDLRILGSSAETWLVAGVMVAAGLVTKYLAAWSSARILGYNRTEGLLIFGMSVNQAAATLAAVLVGFELGIFNEAILSGTIIMIMVTSFVGSLVSSAAGRRAALAEEQKPYDAGLAPSRILIPISNKEKYHDLLELGLMLREKNSPEPLFPLHCIRDGVDVEARVAAGEKLLTQAVMKITAANVPAQALTRVHSNPGEGILQGIKDLRISTIVAGWNGQRSPHGQVFGSILDTLVLKSRQMVLVNRITRPPNTLQRLILVIPPLVHRQAGFAGAFKTIKDLCAQAGTELLVHCTSELRPLLEELNEKMKPALTLNIRIYEDWTQVLPLVMAQYRESDHVLLVSARLGRVAWQPRLDRWPREFLRVRGQATLTVLYPAEEAWTSQVEGEDSSAQHYLEGLFGLEGIHPRIRGLDWERALEELLFATLKKEHRPERIRELAQALVRVGREEPVELSPGTALLHAHVDNLESKILLLTTFEQDIPMDQTAHPVRTLFLLLVPSGQSPEEHLKTLSRIVEFIQIPGVTQALNETRKAGDFRRHFNELYQKKKEKP